MARIADRERGVAQLLPASVQGGEGCGDPHAFEIGAAGDGQRRLLMEEVHGGRSRHNVVALVVARKVQLDFEGLVVARAAQPEELAPVPLRAALVEELPFGVDHARLVGGGSLLDHAVVAVVCLADDHRDALLDDPGLLGGDLLERVTQQGRVLEPDVGDDAQDRHNDVRRVESSPEPGLDHRYLDVALCKVVEGHRGGHFEERQLQSDHLVVVLVHEVHHLLLGNHFTVHADAFAEILQVGRREEARAVAGLLEHCGDDVRHGPFAVGAGDVDREEVPLRVAQMAAECGDAFQSRFVGRSARVFVKPGATKRETRGFGYSS